MTTYDQNKKEKLGGYAYFHQDGLLDFSLGLWLLLVGVSWLAGALEMGGILLLLLIPFWEAAKRSITVPRLPEPMVTAAQRRGVRQTRQFLLALLVGLLLLLLLVFWAVRGGFLPTGVALLVTGYGVVLLGVVLTAVLLAVAFFNSIYSFYNHALLTFAAFVFGQAFGIPIAYILILLGSVIWFGGFLNLHQFLRNHPVNLRLSS